MAFDSWRVRIRSADGSSVGDGVLVDRALVLTCAYVVAEALHVDSAGPRPTGEVQVEFAAAPGISRLALVATEGWIPRPEDGAGGLAPRPGS